MYLTLYAKEINGTRKHRTLGPVELHAGSAGISFGDDGGVWEVNGLRLISDRSLWEGYYKHSTSKLPNGLCKLLKLIVEDCPSCGGSGSDIFDSEDSESDRYFRCPVCLGMKQVCTICGNPPVLICPGHDDK